MAKAKNYDSKIFRILYILNRLDKGENISTRTFADEFNVSMRTVQRDMSLVQSVGFPVVSDDKGLYSFMDGFSLEKVRLSDQEASLISFLGEVTSSLGGGFQDAFKGLLGKIMPQDMDSVYYIKMPEGIKLKRKDACMKTLEEAIEESRRVELEYFKSENHKKYTVNPLRIIFVEGFWYLLAQTTDKELMVKFRIENIKDAKLLDAYFDMPRNIDTILKESVNIWFSGKKDKRVELKVEKEVAKYFTLRKQVPYQKIKKTNKDGSILVESRVGQYEEVIPVILKWIPYIKVNAPNSLKDEILGRIKEYEKDNNE